jgi:hypothetical protein
MKNQWKLIVMLSLFIATLLASSFPMAQVAEAKGGSGIRIALKASAQYPSAKAKAKFKDAGAEKEFQVEIENVKALAGKRLAVIVDGKKVGTFVVNSLGVGRLNLNTIRGDMVPAIHAGSKVVIRLGLKLVASGQF